MGAGDVPTDRVFFYKNNSPNPHHPLGAPPPLSLLLPKRNQNFESMTPHQNFKVYA